jgi:hypothetical protein
MVEHEVTQAGSIIATYEPAGAVATGSFSPPEPSAPEVERQRRIADGRW